MSNPPTSPYFLLSYPSPHVLLVTINREKRLNAINRQAHWDGDAIFSWFDNEPSLRVAVVTGKGTKAFCAGQDLMEQNDNVAAYTSNNGHNKNKYEGSSTDKRDQLPLPPGGFLGVSRRKGKKPIIAAVNGFALGGGFEVTLNWFAAFSP